MNLISFARGRGAVPFVLAACLLASAARAVDDPWADAVVSYNAVDPNAGFNTPQKTIGKPVGGGTFAPNNSSLHSLGHPASAPGSYVLLKFDTPVTDDPLNPFGLDCIVYSNAFYVGGDPQRKLVEPALVEISEDMNGNGQPDDPWYVIPGSRNLSASVLPAGIPNPAPPLAGSVLNPNTDGTEYDWGYAELGPTQVEYRDNYVRPDDPHAVGLSPRSGGGDAFDIAWAKPEDASGNPGGIQQFTFIRISAFISGGVAPFGNVTPEIDAVADVAPEVDADGDGVLDEYETRVAGTDPARPESTVLALEIPGSEGGSPAGTLLGDAHDAAGDRIALYSNGTRSGARNYNCNVDILSTLPPAPAPPGLLVAARARNFSATEVDFTAALVQTAQLTFAYAAADIAGMDEAMLAPYRFDGAQYTQAGIDTVNRDTGTNTVTFRTRYPGIFALIAPAGTGDSGGGHAVLALTATPPGGIVAEPGNTVAVQSGPVLDAHGAAVADGTPFTVSIMLGTIATPDADAFAGGVQVLVAQGRLSFQVAAGTVAGTAQIQATSLDGTIGGSLGYAFLPGPPAGLVATYTTHAGGPVLGPVPFQTEPIADAYGNALPDGTLLTLVADGGTPVYADADAAVGYQVATRNGIAVFALRLDTHAKANYPVTVQLYGDAAQTNLVSQQTFTFEIQAVPIGHAAAAMLGLLIAALGLWRIPRERVRT